MIKQYLSNTNENATVFFLQKNLKLNKAGGGQHQIQGQTSFPKTVICTVVPLWIMCSYASMGYIKKICWHTW